MRVRPTRLRRLRVRKAIGSGVLVAVALATAGGYVALTKDVTLVVDGATVSVRTMSARVGDLLSSEGIVLSPEDVVVPTTRTPLQDGMTVFVDLDVLGARRFALRAHGLGVVSDRERARRRHGEGPRRAHQRGNGPRAPLGHGDRSGSS